MRVRWTTSAWVLVACGGSQGPVTVEEAQGYLDEIESMERVTPEPMITVSHAIAETVDVFVDPRAADAYLTVMQSEPIADVSFAERTVLIKQQYDADGAINSWTLMVKGSPGQNPDVGDWWFGFAGADGVVQSVSDACQNCHLARPDSDYVYGL